MRKSISVALLFTALMATVDAQAAIHYRLVQIGDVPANGVGVTFVSDVNQFGHVVGYTSTVNGVEAFVWHNGHRRVLGEMRTSDVTAAINDLGDIAVLLFNPSTGVDEPVLLRGNRTLPLGSPSGLTFYPRSINNRGEVLGYTRDASLLTRTYLRKVDGTFQELQGLPNLNSSSMPNDLNNRGVAVGYNAAAVSGSSLIDCLRWTGVEAEMLNPPDQQRTCQSFHLNDAGVIAGFGNFTGPTRGFTWNNGEIALSRLLHSDDVGNQAIDINDFGVVVGASFDKNAVAVPTLWRPDGTPVDLSAAISPHDPLRPYVTLDTALRILNNGTIIVQGLDTRSDGGSVPYLLVPSLL